MAARPVLEIARREFLENALSWRLLLALGLSVLILGTSVISLGATYQEDRGAFQAGQASMEKQAPGFGGDAVQVSIEIQRVLARPHPLSVLLGGSGDAAQRDAASNTPFSAPATGGSASPTNLRFTPLDLGFVATVVMTFVAVMLSYDAISGERERGTLKLLLANPVPKDAILLGKFLGALASLLLPFGVTVLVGLAILQGVGISLTGDEWVRLGLALLLFLPLASAFLLLGLWVSSMTRRSSTSLLAMLLIWLVLVFGAGNVAAVMAKGAAATTSDAALEEQFQALSDRERNQFADIQQEVSKIMENQRLTNGTLSPEDQARMSALQKQQQQTFKATQAERAQVMEAARRQLADQLALAESIAIVSPSEAYRTLATALAHSDYWSYKRAFEASEAYKADVDKARAAWNDAHPNPGTFVAGGPGVSYVVSLGPGGSIQAAGDPFQAPEFTYQPASVNEQLSSGSALQGLLMLLGINLVAFAGAYVAFLRYDVR